MFDVEVDKLTKCFGDFCAVNELSFTVSHGEVRVKAVMGQDSPVAGPAQK